MLRCPLYDRTQIRQRASGSEFLAASDRYDRILAHSADLARGLLSGEKRLADDTMRQPIEPAEFGRLQKLFGPIPRRPERLELSAKDKEHWWRVLDQDRRAEVVLIVPRPGRRVLLISKPNYPPDTFRLPTGGVGLEEEVLTAAAREVLEETGLALRPERLLAVVDWTFAHQGRSRRFASYLVLFPTTDAPAHAADTRENISAYRELLLGEIDGTIAHLRQLPADWRNWGEQRAVPHQLVGELLRK
jgi:8-oxo-dGTP diphosphatase